MKAYRLLSDPSKWTQDSYAKDADGRTRDPDSSHAVCWCLLGALHKCYPEEDLFSKALSQIEVMNPFILGVVVWNDVPERTYEEVVSLLRKADA